MARDVICAHSAKPDTTSALVELRAQLTDIDPVAVLFFCSANHNGLAISAALRELAPNAEIIGATTAGEFTSTAYTQGGVSVVALSAAKVKRCAAAMTVYDPAVPVEMGVHAAAKAMAGKLAVDLRELDPAQWVGIVMGTTGHVPNGHEEEVNAVLGHVAPLLSFLGGSAGDNFKLKETKVFHGDKETATGSVFLLLELAVPHIVLKACSFEPTPARFVVGPATGRVVHELNGKPAVQAYTEQLGVKPEELNMMVFASNPLGLIIDGEPWVRSPLAALPDGSLMMGCGVLPGTTLTMLKPSDLVGDTKRAFEAASAKLGSTPSVGILFNCAHRCMAIDAMKIEAPFREAISAFPVAGFHSYGENWLAYMNQTLIGLLIA